MIVTSLQFPGGHISAVLSMQAEIYSSDFHAERAAREKLHEEKERLAAQLEFVKKQHSQLQEEMESLGRYGLQDEFCVCTIALLLERVSMALGQHCLFPCLSTGSH